MFAFYEWVDLPENVLQAAMDLGFDESNWEEYQTNPIEYIKFAALVSDTPLETVKTVVGDFVPPAGDIKAALTTLDLFDDTGICWDFYVNHYDGFTWAELGDTFTPFGQNVQDLVSIIGWDETMWDDKEFTGSIPEAECKFWITLDPVEKWAYASLGWDGLSFDSAPCDPRCPKSLACPLNA